MPKPGNVFLKLFLALSSWMAATSIQAQDPVANFTADNTSGCAPLRVTFTDHSTGDPDSYSWDFGNGQLSTKPAPVVTYTQPGTYSVRLIVKNASGIDDEIKTDYITVFASPTAAFTANLKTACVPAAVQFTDHSTSPPGSSVTSWQWDFGDGGTSIQQNPTHTYTNTGFYTVTLQITNSNGCKRTASIGRYIRIVSGINVDFAFSQLQLASLLFLLISRINQVDLGLCPIHGILEMELRQLHKIHPPLITRQGPTLSNSPYKVTLVAAVQTLRTLWCRQDD
jgi:chitodextrinase